MTIMSGAAPSRVFDGWWVALALSTIVFLSSGIRFTIAHQTGSSLGSWLGGFLFDATGGYGAALAVAGVLLLVAAALSLSIDEAARPACRAVPLPSRPHPVAGGR